jgi:hypothetical protein
MSVSELLDLPVAVPLEDANRALGLGRGHGYALAKAGDYPVKVLKFGRSYRVTRASLLELLGVSPSEAMAERAEPAPVRLTAVRPYGDAKSPLLRSVN